jgi:hypothetical protein
MYEQLIRYILWHIGSTEQMITVIMYLQMDTQENKSEEFLLKCTPHIVEEGIRVTGKLICLINIISIL